MAFREKKKNPKHHWHKASQNCRVLADGNYPERKQEIIFIQKFLIAIHTGCEHDYIKA